MGQQLQAKLGEMTGRRTVPNVMVRGRSIGGGDDVAHLDETDTLIEKINSLGGKQIQQIKHV
jgi:glutaredoxin